MICDNTNIMDYGSASWRIGLQITDNKTKEESEL